MSLIQAEGNQCKYLGTSISFTTGYGTLGKAKIGSCELADSFHESFVQLTTV